MTNKIIALSLLALTFLSPSQAVAQSGVVNGVTSNGFYWQYVRANGRFLCRSTTTSKFQKHQACKNAGAIQPKV